MPLKLPQTLYRSGVATVRKDEGTVRMSVSSDTAYLRESWDGEQYLEVLDHGPTGIDLSRMKAGTSLLFNHERSVLLGRQISHECDGHKLYVTCKLSKAPDVASHRVKIEEGILVATSVGYQISGDGKQIGTQDGIPIIKFRWQPFEQSLVTVEADVTVGIGRAANSQKPNLTRTIQIMNEPEIPEPTDNDQPPRRMTTQQQIEHSASMRRHAQGMKASAQNYIPFDVVAEAEKFILQGSTVNEFKKHLLDNWRQAGPVGAGSPGASSDRDFHGGNSNRTLAGRLFDAPRFKDFVKQSGRKYCSVEFPDITNVRTALTLSGSGVTAIDHSTLLQPVASERLTVADLFQQATTTGSTVRWIKEESYTNTAATVAEAGNKPELTLDLSDVDSVVRKIAAFVRVSDEMLADVPAALEFINMRLRYAVEEREELQLIAGDGTGTNLVGILSTSGIQTHAVGADVRSAAIRKAVTKVQVGAKLQPTGVILHPNDFEALSLERDANNAYLIGSIFAMNEMNVMVRTPSIWGLPIVVTTAMTENTGIVGAFKPCAWLFRRQGVTLEASNQEGDCFTTNRVNIRCEERLTNAIVLPAGFCQVTGL